MPGMSSINGEKLRELRLERKLGFVELSVIVDVDRRTLSNYEKESVTDASAIALYRLAQYYRVPMESLMKSTAATEPRAGQEIRK